MATSLDFCQYVCGQIRGDYDVTFKKMFGEYMIYLNAKPLLLLCDDMVYVKKLKEIEELVGGESGFPYEGAKEYYIIDADDVENFNEILKILEQITPLKKYKGELK